MLPNESILVEGLWDSPKAFVASEVAQQRSVLLITGGVREDAFVDNLAYLCPGKSVEFPAWETLPGEDVPPSPDVLGKRFEALYTLLSSKTPRIVLCPLQALLQKVAPKEVLKPLLHIWKKGTRVEFETVAALLTELGFVRAAVVSDKGEFAIRGGIVDLFPVSSSDPYRVEFFGDEIEEIRRFDPVSQKSVGKAEEFFLSPAKEMPLLQKAKKLVSIVDYLEDPVIFWDDLLAIEDTYAGLKGMPAARSHFFEPLETLLKRFEGTQQIFCTELSLQEEFEMFGHLFKAKKWNHGFYRPVALDDPDIHYLFLSANETEEQEIKRLLPSLPEHARFQSGYLTSGYVRNGQAVVPYAEISKKVRVRRQKWRSAHHSPSSEFHALTPGDLVVHFHSGIGRYLGMEKHTNHLGQQTEFLTLQYADSGKLFVPLSQSHLVSRYIGARDVPPSLSELGSKRWQKVKAGAQAQIVGYANELLQLYAQRSASGGFSYSEDGEVLQQFEEEFPYAATEDQVLAVQKIKEDMISSEPMDRLVCGDVGYGKTEVAMRAAFKAVADGQKQVAVLVPTTVLAVQHFENFSSRMKGFAVQIGVVSRFHSPKEVKETLKRVAEGKIDILIGTHRILSKDVHFKDLGLIIVDEEQRFGVKSKEHLKKLKTSVDCLTLSATPIPRTLYMSLVHARDMSVIATPPQDRLPVKIIIAETEEAVIQNALMREFARGGQAFYIHNRVESIYQRADFVQKLVPSAKIGIVHGQMDPEAVEDVFHQFKSGTLDLLFATTIIENGVDIPNANTILIDRADTYGLADLYQLKGRVGRWNRAAYAYFLIPKGAKLPELARKRLNALVEAGSYGGGMKIAMRDLEIRGAGDILGVQQSGQVSQIGFHLYCKLLKRAIDALKKQAPISFNETKMEFHFDARLPEDYINEVSLRMEIYYRLGEAVCVQEIDEIMKEMKDRFGEPPESVLWLYYMTRIRVWASERQFSLLKFGRMSLYAELVKGKEIVKKNVLLKKTAHPAQLEETVKKSLSEQFRCPL